jgi:hypothetical protein
MFPMLYSTARKAEDVMGLRENFQKLIERKQAEIRELEVQIREAQSYLQALQDSAKLLPNATDNNGAASAEFTLRPGTSLAGVRDIIKENGGPMHINEILTKLGKAIDNQNRVSLVGTLGSYSRKGRIFSRTAPNTFGLLELGHRESTVDAIPEMFGKMD